MKLEDHQILKNQDLINCIESILDGLVESIRALDEKNYIKTKTLLLTEHKKFILRYAKFYSKMHTSMVLLKSEQSNENSVQLNL